MMSKLLLAIYIATLGLWFYGWWPNIAQVAFVEGQTAEGISAGWAALWEMKGLLAWCSASFGVLILLVLETIHSRLSATVDKEREAKNRKREQAIEDRGREIMADAREQVAKAHRELERANQSAKNAEAREVTAKARAKKVREENEQAQRNVRDQLKRLKRENAKLKAQRMLN